MLVCFFHEGSDFNLYFFVVDTKGNPASTLEYIYQTAYVLKEKGYNLYIVSNCQSGYIEAFLEHYGFGHYFEDIECFGNNGLKKGDNIRNVVDNYERENIKIAVDVNPLNMY